MVQTQLLKLAAWLEHQRSLLSYQIEWIINNTTDLDVIQLQIITRLRRQKLIESLGSRLVDGINKLVAWHKTFGAYFLASINKTMSKNVVDAKEEHAVLKKFVRNQ